MARKAVIEGGKRDEIIKAAEELFFTEGFEKTTVRKILEKVDGEVGMFYHYFKSKEELFDVVTDRFFRQYETDFNAMVQYVDTVEEFAELFLSMFEASMKRYAKIENNMHWTVRSAFHERTLRSLIPTAEKLLEQFGYDGKYPIDIAAGKITADVSFAIHSKSFQKMTKKDRKNLLMNLIKDNLA
ncbi:MAG: TetR/AcrR family transcriptional regulator [Solobacterium sp.]|nr:TetR/AcrR family transcriptional regulator [Solobacterium sp.]